MVGWLQVTPEGSEIKRSQIRPEQLPDVDPADSTLDHWTALGLCAFGMNGPDPLPWQELRSYAALSGGAKPAIFWETLRGMSVAYANELGDKSPLSIAPINRGLND